MSRVLRALWREPRIRDLRDFPRVLVLAFALGCFAGSIAAAASGLLSLTQICAEIACMAFGAGLLWAWWQIGGHAL